MLIQLENATNVFRMCIEKMLQANTRTLGSKFEDIMYYKLGRELSSDIFLRLGF